MTKQSYTLKILNSRKVALNTTEITFERGKGILPFCAGQYVKVTLPKLLYADPKGESRDFSIVSSPNTIDTLVVTFRGSESGYKRTLLELPIGTAVSVDGPYGVFTLPSDTGRSLVLLAGGIGITPCLSMLSYAKEENLPYDITLLYANTNPKRAAYLSELDALSAESKHLIVKKRFGDITRIFIEESTKDIESPLWYVVGPPAMVEASRDLLLGLGVIEANLFVEEMSGYSGEVHLTSASRLKGSVTSSLSTPEMLSATILEVLDNSALVAVTDVEGDIIFVNNKFVEISQYSQDELMGQNHRMLKSGYHPQSFYGDLWKTISMGKVWNGEIKNRAKDGSFYWVDTYISPVFNNDGEITAYAAVRFPITEKKEAEEKVALEAKRFQQVAEDVHKKNEELEKIRKATLNILEDLDEEKKAVENRVLDRTKQLEQEKEKLMQVTQNMKGGAILLDEKRNVIFTNANIWDMLGATVEKINDTDALDLLFNKFKDTDIKKYFQRCIHGETFHVPEIESGERVYEIFFHYLEDHVRAERKHFGYFILIFDITDVKLLERSKSELVAVASHQLRTPLTAMRGNVEMLIDESYGKLSSDQHELLDDIEISTIRLIGMVNDMLDITKLEAGNLEMTPEKLDIGKIIRSIVEDLKDYAHKHAFTITHDPVAESVPSVYGDRVRVRQIFQNLIDNAIKYSRHPGVLTISYHSRKGVVEIELKDNGIGIPKNEQSKLFGRFYRASNSAKSASSGSGLGLYIVKSIVEQLNGSIRFESVENVGTTFYITLPTEEKSITST